MITRQPTNKMITALQDVTFTCEAKGFDVKYEWKHHRNNGVIGRQSTLTISQATPLDSDQYYCVAMTEGGYAFSNNVTLTVVDGKNNNIPCVPYNNVSYKWNYWQTIYLAICLKIPLAGFQIHGFLLCRKKPLLAGRYKVYI